MDWLASAAQKPQRHIHLIFWISPSPSSLFPSPLHVCHQSQWQEGKGTKGKIHRMKKKTGMWENVRHKNYFFLRDFNAALLTGPCLKRREFYVSLSRFPLWGSEDDVWGWAKKRKETDIFEKGEREKFNSLFSPPTIPKLGGNLFSLFSIALPSAFPGKTWVVVFAKCRLSFFSREVRLGSFSPFCILGSSRQLQQPNPTGLTPWEES